MRVKRIVTIAALTMMIALPLVVLGQVRNPRTYRPPVRRTYYATVTLRGYKEVPSNRSRATGFARVTLDTRTNTLRYALSFRGLSSRETGAHIHGLANSRQNAPVLHPLALGSPVSGAWHYGQDLELAILNGRTYFNVHSERYPNGEIRGQIIFR